MLDRHVEQTLIVYSVDRSRYYLLDKILSSRIDVDDTTSSLV